MDGLHSPSYFQVYYYYYSLRVFHISISWWSFTGVWVIASLLKFPGLLSVFCTILAMQQFGWSPLVLSFPSPTVLSVNVPRASIIIAINVTFMFYSFFSSLVRSRYLFFFSLSFNFTRLSATTAKSGILQFLSFLLLLIIIKAWLTGLD